jgi:hypothetical protein
MKVENKFPARSIGGLVSEVVQGITLSYGLIIKIQYDNIKQDYLYTILWNDTMDQEEVMENFVEWRIENNIWNYYPVKE